LEASEVELDGLGSLRRTHRAAEVTEESVGREVVVAGWVQRRRDHGGVIFVDLRDRWGLVQVVFRPDASSQAHERAGHLRSEFVLIVRGTVERRSAETVNADLPTGAIEISASEISILNSATPPPFPIEDDPGVDDAVRLRHRIHDLRRGPLQRALELRHRLNQTARKTLAAQDFLEVETPVLSRATPEGARDFLVPSRLQPGEFYALPQSPQLLKQLLMISGFDRYFQIARCFRDEDGRADRQLEFTQIDLEMSFVGVEEVIEIVEELTACIWQGVLGVELPRPFPRMSYTEAMSRYGTDKPDTRVELELLDLTEVFRESGFRAFQQAVASGGIVKCLPIHAASDLSRGDIDRLESFVKKELGARGLAWIRVNAEGGWQSPIVKFFSDEERERIAAATEARPGTVLFFQADQASRANAILARLRVDLGLRLGRVADRDWEPLVVTGFPVFDQDPDTGKLDAMHMPFVAPLEEDIPLLETEPERVRGSHYDMVMNGVELGSGSLRNHRSDVQRRILAILGYSKADMESRFGFLLNSLDSGAPPHGGFAFGVDRMVMLLSGVDNLRDVIAFPKTQRGQDLLMGSPSDVDTEQLSELSLRLRPAPGGSQ